MYHLHLGVRTTQRNQVVRALFSLRLRAEINGDGWVAWGDRIGNAGNDDLELLHVVVPVRDRKQAVLLLALLPKTEPDEQGYQASLTSVENWDHVYEAFK